MRDPRLCRGKKRLLRRGTRRRHGGINTAALRADLLIRDAIQPLLPLAGAVAAEHQVGVTVNQPWRHQTSLKVMRIGVRSRERRLRYNRQHAPLTDNQRMMVQQAIRRRLRRIERRQTEVSPERIIR